MKIKIINPAVRITKPKNSDFYKITGGLKRHKAVTTLSKEEAQRIATARKNILNKQISKSKTNEMNNPKKRRRNPANPGNPRRRRRRNPTVTVSKDMFSGVLVEAGASAGGAMTAYYMPKLIAQFLPSLNPANQSTLTKYLIKGVPIGVITWLLWSWNKQVAKAFFNGAVGFTAVELMNDISTKSGMLNKTALRNKKIIPGTVAGDDDLENLTMGELAELMGRLETVDGEYMYGEDDLEGEEDFLGKSAGSSATSRSSRNTHANTRATRFFTNQQSIPITRSTNQPGGISSTYPFGYIRNARP